MSFAALAPEEPIAGKGWDKRPIRQGDVARVLAKCPPVFELDLHHASSNGAPRRVSLDAEVTTAGQLDGFGLYFRAWFDDNLGFGTGPEDSVGQRGPLLFRTERTALSTGDRLTFEVTLDHTYNADAWGWHYEARDALGNPRSSSSR